MNYGYSLFNYGYTRDPFKINKNNSRKSVLFKYKIHILNKLKNDEFKNKFIKLKIKT